MDVGPDKVVIRYLKEDEYVREVAHRRKPPRHEAIYKLTSQGLELEADHEIPF
jgi:DNA-binding HxlR family transcriptional regulator